MKKLGSTYCFTRPVYVAGYAACVGTKEGQGPLGSCFDVVLTDNRYGQETWEKAESAMVETAARRAVSKAGLVESDIGCALGGDLLNQCIASGYAMRQLGQPYFGLYGACSTMADSLLLGGALIAGGFEETALCMASSHFCSAERQYRYPLEYGGQRPPTAQWTVTGAGAVVLGTKETGIRLTRATPGRVFDPGIKDAANMGAAMAQSAYETLRQFFLDTGTGPAEYDLIATGDLGAIGSSLLESLFRGDGMPLGQQYTDCGLLMFDRQAQDVHAGGSGCGCCASVLCGHILPQLQQGTLRRVLLCATGAMMSPVSVNQGESIPGICHLLELEVCK